MPPHVRVVLASQAGVISRRQLHELGVSDNVLARWVRTRLLVRLLRGAYVDHTGEPTYDQWCWAAVLAHEPSALAGEAALRAAEGQESRRGLPQVSLITPWETRRVGQQGIAVSRRRDFTALLHPGSGLPRMRYEEAVLDVVQEAGGELDRIAQLALAVNSRRTSARRLRDALERRQRFSSRQLVEALVADVAAGTCSVLEHRYHHRVERPHGLPRTRLQARSSVRGRTTYRDGLAGEVCIELDGMLHERFGQRDHDFDRDLVAAASGIATVRLSYGQVFGRPCWTAAHLAEVHRARGWSGHPRGCGPGCVIS